LWQLFRSCYQMGRKPYLFGGLCLLGGYSWGWVTRAQRPVSAELIRFHQREQMQRLRQSLFRAIGIGAVREACN
jgi:hypothetical protein